MPCCRRHCHDIHSPLRSAIVAMPAHFMLTSFLPFVRFIYRARLMPLIFCLLFLLLRRILTDYCTGLR